MLALRDGVNRLRMMCHLHYTHNLEGDAPERDEPNKKSKGKVAATTWTTNVPWGAQLD